MENQGKQGSRIWELDFFRGIALILMIYFHIIYDLKEFYNLPIPYENGVNFYIGKFFAILFIFISGISSSLSTNNIKRGLKILGCGLILTIAVGLFNEAIHIKFGILHFLGICMLLFPLIVRVNKYVLLALGTFIIYPGRLISNIYTSLPFLFPIGIITDTFTSVDYYPLIPWLGIFLYGTALGKILYDERKQSLFPFSLADHLISKAGRHTLLLYMVHQPAILLILTLLNKLELI